MNIAPMAVYIEDQEEAERFWTEKVGFVVQRDQPMGSEGR